jgi:hypothetical protein
MAARHILSNDQRAAIGDVVAESVWMETLAAEAIVIFARLSESSIDALLRGKMLDAKLQVLEEITETAVREEKRKEFAELVATMRNLNRDRVTVVHGMWRPKSGGYAISDIAKGKLDPPDEVVFHGRGKERVLTSEQVMDLAKRIGDASHRLIRFLVEELNTREKEQKN